MKNLGNQTVSWIRHHDTHLLSIGLFTYTPDKRFNAIHKSSSENWVLEIRSTTIEDEGEKNVTALNATVYAILFLNVDLICAQP